MSLNIPSGINAAVKVLWPLPIVTSCQSIVNLAVSNLPIVQTGLIDIVNIVDEEINKLQVTGAFTLSGSGNVTITTTSDTVIIGATLEASIEDVVYTTGNQTINGNKTFQGLFNIDTVGVQSLYGINQATISSPSSEAGIQLNNYGEGGKTYALFSTNNASSIGAGKFLIADASNGNPVFTINDGLIGLDNLNPNYLLDVNGNINSNGLITNYISGGPSYIGIIDNNGVISLNQNQRILKDSVGTNSLNWDNRILMDYFQNYSIQYADRFLRNSNQDYVLDWNNRVLSGHWITNGLSISGFLVLTNNTYRANTVLVGSNATTQSISFSSPLASSGYSVALSFDTSMATANTLWTTNKTISGFTINLLAGLIGGLQVDYTATLYN